MLFGNGTGGVDWVLVCLGNPGEKYEKHPAQCGLHGS